MKIQIQIGDTIKDIQSGELVEIVGPGMGGWPEVKMSTGYTYYINPRAIGLINSTPTGEVDNSARQPLPELASLARDGELGSQN